MSSLKVPILFLVFNRPDTTKKVFEQIRKAKPSTLYVACDGPREGCENDNKKINDVQDIATKVDWTCELKILFRNKNLGCKKAVSEAITWFFENEEQGIILEDDCLPHIDFFNFCENLLHRYANDERVSVITGNNFQNGKWRGDASYYFSKYNHCWGWATWKRAWQHYEGNLYFWNEWSKSKKWMSHTPNNEERKYWTKIFNQVFDGKIDSWAYPWTASVWYKGGLTATPNVNLVSNIGFAENATHTKSENNNLSKLPVYDLKNFKHPTDIKRDIEADNFTSKEIFKIKNFSLVYKLLYFPLRVINFFLNKYKKLKN